MAGIQSPCMGCMERTIEPNCHDEAICDRWREFVEIKKREQAEIKRRKDQEYAEWKRRLRLKKKRTKK